MNFDAIYTDPVLIAKKDNQIKYLENLYATGTQGQKAWAKEELSVNYQIEKPKVTQSTAQTAVKQVEAITSVSVPLTSSGNTIESGRTDVVKSNPLPLLIIAFLVMLFLAD